LKGKLLSEPPLASVVETGVEGSTATKNTAGFGEGMVHINKLVENCSAIMEEFEPLDVPDEIKLFMKVCPPPGQPQCRACLE
jgi:PII-like signaling protein